jgi:hypothetical protein
LYVSFPVLGSKFNLTFLAAGRGNCNHFMRIAEMATVERLQIDDLRLGRIGRSSTKAFPKMPFIITLWKVNRNYVLVVNILGWHLGPETGYPDWGFSWFSLVPPVKCRDSTLN